MALLFSYGTLQQPDVQRATFGRLLEGRSDALPGFEPSFVRIEDPRLAAAAGRSHHDNVAFNGRPDSRVAGTVFEVTESELVAADRYEEPAAYERMEVVLASGRRAWVYVRSGAVPVLSFPALATARLRLRLPRADDGPFLFRLMNDPDWLRHIGDRNVRSVADAAEYVGQRMLPVFRQHGFGMCVVETLADGQAAGICGLVKRPALVDVDLGFAFLAEHRGRGYAVEAAAAILADARARLGRTRVVAITSLDNVASARVLERVGMVDEGLVTGDGGVPLRLYAWNGA